MTSLEPVTYQLAAIDIELGKITQTPMTTGKLGDFSSSAAHGSGHAVRCKLPKLQMDEFSGDPLAWQGFWDRCQITIHNNTSITEIDKFNYFKGCLKEDALAAISGLTQSFDN